MLPRLHQRERRPATSGTQKRLWIALVLLESGVFLASLPNCKLVAAECPPLTNRIKLKVARQLEDVPADAGHMFRTTLDRMLRGAGVAAQDDAAGELSKHSDLGELQLEIEGSAVSAAYAPHGNVHPQAEGPPGAADSVQYSGASMKGKLTWNRDGKTTVHEFAAERRPPYMLDRQYPTPSAAPFDRALCESHEFLSVWFKTVQEMVGTDGAARSLAYAYFVLAQPGYEPDRAREFLDLTRRLDANWSRRILSDLSSPNPHCWTPAGFVATTLEFQDITNWSPSPNEKVVLSCVQGKFGDCDRFGDEAIPSLEAVLNADGALDFGRTVQPNGNWQSRAAETLGRIGTPAAVAALRRCRGRSPEVEAQLLRLDPPLYMRPWFLAFAAVGAIGLLGFAYHRGWIPKA